MIFKSVGGGCLQNLKNPLALLLAFSLVSCHPAPAMASGIQVFQVRSLSFSVVVRLPRNVSFYGCLP